MVVPFYERENESTFVKLHSLSPSPSPFSKPYLPASAFSFGVLWPSTRLMTRQQFRCLGELKAVVYLWLS